MLPNAVKEGHPAFVLQAPLHVPSTAISATSARLAAGGDLLNSKKRKIALLDFFSAYYKRLRQ